jgi:hypothetical protein
MRIEICQESKTEMALADIKLLKAALDRLEYNIRRVNNNKGLKRSIYQQWKSIGYHHLELQIYVRDLIRRDKTCGL